MGGAVRAAAVVLGAAMLLGAGVLLGRVRASAEPAEAARWLAEWSRSAGFGGTAAIVAAAIAYRAARANAARQQWVDRKVQWWARAQWALERVLSDDGRTQAIGLRMLRALARSEWAGEHESDLVDAAVDRLWQSEAEPDDRERARCPESGDRRGSGTSDRLGGGGAR
jgi:hypothetical protein